ncbi:hypothetical protein U3516DRAFT_774725 [Neocallimastix sp. 'constans']
MKNPSYLNHRTKRVVFAALTYIPQRMLTQYLNKTDSLHNSYRSTFSCSEV